MLELQALLHAKYTIDMHHLRKLALNVDSVLLISDNAIDTRKYTPQFLTCFLIKMKVILTTFV
jgi:hypothetical protein